MRRSTALLVALGSSTVCGLVTGCADDDPRFGGAGAIQNVHVFDDPDPPAVDAGGDASARALFTPVWTALEKHCGGCHAPPGSLGAPAFFGPDEASSYDLFKAKSYHLEGGKPPSSTYGLLERGVHTGPAVTPAEKELVVKWRAAERP